MPKTESPRYLVIALSLLWFAHDAHGSEEYELVFSTYLGGSTDWDQGRDVCADAQGNVYVTGGATSSDFPVTPGAYDTSYNTGGDQTGSGGNCDAFVSKFDSAGNLVWSTYLGGPNYDRGYAIEVDDDGYVYVSGRAGPGFPVTGNAVQPQFKGLWAGIYGMQNGFVAKLTPDGSDLVWATYMGLGSLLRDLDIDDAGNVYTSLPYEGSSSYSLPSSWFAGSLQPTRSGGAENGVVKIAADGASVIWATWLGGSGDEQKEENVRVDTAGNVYVGVGTKSADIPTTAGAHDQSYNGGWDAYFAKVSADGTSLLFATYFGAAGDQLGCSTHNLAVDAAGNLYHSSHSVSGDYPITSGVYQTSFGGGTGDMVVAKFAADGSLVASTYVGGSGGEDPDGIYVDAAGNVYLSGATDSADFPTTVDAYQTVKGASADAFFVKLSADFGQLLYATYLGGDSYDYGRSSFLDEQGNWYVTGSSDGDGWPAVSAYQPGFAGGVGSCTEGGCYAGDAVLARFSPSAPPPLPDAGVEPVVDASPGLPDGGAFPGLDAGEGDAITGPGGDDTAPEGGCGCRNATGTTAVGLVFVLLLLLPGPGRLGRLLRSFAGVKE